MFEFKKRMSNKLSGFFEKYLKNDPLFIDKKVLQANYAPDTIPHRDDQIEYVANILAPALKLEKPSNLFVYGKSGTGKTLTMKSIISNMEEIAKKKKIDLKFFYLNCKLKRVADTEYRLIAQLARMFGKDVPATGLPTDEVYKIFVEAIDDKEQLLILVLDEIDQLVNKVGDEILYNLTRLNPELEKAELSLVGISNNLFFMNSIDARVKSSLSEEELVFPPYNALQLQDILKKRSKLAFRNNVVKKGVIEKCAAYAAREHGDARRALDLFRVAGELAERSGDKNVDIKHIDNAEEKIENDMVLEMVNTQPKQFQLTLYSIMSVCALSNDSISTGDVFGIYKDNCLKVGLKPLTQRRVSDIINELDMMGIITGRVISRGRYGRSKEISLALPSANVLKVKEVLKDILGL